MPAPVLHLIPHTHWDREWYEPFEVMRYRLVKVVDRILAVLEEQPTFRHFTLDGQTAAIEDYLEIRPGAEDDVAAAVRSGRLSIGPFRVLADGFLCSPETLVRNLQQGAATCERLGGRMEVGYLPDPFGHPSQMPQLLRLAGIGDACVWRGVPRAVDRIVFAWEAPSGDWVRTAYLPFGYGHAAAMPTDPDDLDARIDRIVRDLGPFLDGPLIPAPNGNDHADIQEGLIDAVGARASATVRIGSLPEALAELAEVPAVRWRGELRSAARANLLPGVVSARAPLKRQSAAVAVELERYAEPLTALAWIDPGRLLDRAWRRVVENAGHDSITGCGVDAVARDVESRYTEASRIAELLARDGLAGLASMVDTSALAEAAEGVVVFNPGPRPRAGAVEVTIAAPPGEPGAATFIDAAGVGCAAQVIEVTEQVALDMDLRGEQLSRLIPLVASRHLAGLFVNGLTITQARPTTIRLAMGLIPEGRFDVEGAKRRVEELSLAHPRARFRVIGNGPPLCRMLIATPPVPGLGWSVLRPRDGGDQPQGVVRASGTSIDNGIVSVSVSEDGSIRTTTASGFVLEGLLGISDRGDAGDEYTCAAPDDDVVVREPSAPVIVHEVASGPVEAALRVDRVFRVPAGLDASGRRRARKHVALPVTTTVRLRAGEPFVRVTMDVDNTARDHVLEAVFPMPFPPTGSVAEGAFSIDRRPVVGEGGPTESPSSTFPSRRWVDVADGEHGLAILHRGVPAYAITERGELAITLLRSVGWLSTHGGPQRAGPAGPVIATPGAQVLGAHTIEFALYPHEGDHRAAQVTEAADAYTAGLRAIPARAHGGRLSALDGALSLEPASVQLSAVVPGPSRVALRIWNASDDVVDAVVRVGDPLPRRRARLVDLLGGEIEALDVTAGQMRTSLRAWQIATIELHDD